MIRSAAQAALATGILFLLLILPPPEALGQAPIPATPTAWVTDTVGFMSPAAVARLNARLEAYERQTGHQLLVWIGSSTGGEVIETWAVRAFEQWKVGRRGIDDGLVLILMTEDRRLRFEVGYGLEGDVPDVTASRIINETIVPRIQAGDADGAITAGMEAITAAIGVPMEGSEPAARQPGPGQGRGRPQLSLGEIIVFGIGALIVLFIFVTNPSLAIWLLVSMLQSGGRGGYRGRGGGGFGGGGGFSGGGGRSGGGGASGSW